MKELGIQSVGVNAKRTWGCGGLEGNARPSDTQLDGHLMKI